jgi:hypothetical protein
MSEPARFIKDPQAVLDYQIDWAAWLGSDTISASTWTAETGITIASSTNTTTTATVWLSGGTVGTSYVATNHITTAGGRQDDRRIKFEVEDK